LRKRIDKFGVTQPNIQKLGESGQILVELLVQRCRQIKETITKNYYSTWVLGNV
jgi:preprotein translocase subunit SecD